MDKNLDHLKKNYDRYFLLLKKFFQEDCDAIDNLENELGERLFLTPRDITKEDGGVPGGLIMYTLELLKYAKMFECAVVPHKLIRVMLIHELGKVGSLTEDLFIPQTSQWHIENTGKTYKYGNPFKMSPSHRTLFFVSKYGFHLDEEEWVAVLTSSGFQYDENRFYANEQLSLAQALQSARVFATKTVKYNFE